MDASTANILLRPRSVIFILLKNIGDMGRRVGSLRIPLPFLMSSVSPSLRRAFEPDKYFSYPFSVDYRFYFAQTNSMCFLILAENLKCFYFQNDQNRSFRTEAGISRSARLFQEDQLQCVLKESCPDNLCLPPKVDFQK